MTKQWWSTLFFALAALCAVLALLAGITSHYDESYNPGKGAELGVKTKRLLEGLYRIFICAGLYAMAN